MSFPVAALTAEIEKRSANRLGCRFLGGAEKVCVERLAPLDHAGPEHVAFLAQPRLRDAAKASHAGVIVLTEADVKAMWPEGAPADRPLIVCTTPYAWFAWALQVMTEPKRPTGFIHPKAVVEEGAKVSPEAVIEAGAYVGAGAVIGARTRLFPGSYVGAGTTVGEDAILYPNAVVYHGCTIGNRVILHSGSVIGADGFGFAPFAGEWVKIPQIGGVTIEDDVEIGANTTVDRGALENTVIARGSKLDNQIQIGHNGRVGEYTVMAACTGVAGSTTIGSHCMIGGAANINGHIAIPDGSEVGPATSIMHWQEGAKQLIGIFPAQERRAFERTAVLMMRLGDMRKRIQTLEAEVEKLSK